jgi:DNA-binding SARP family transcriptional activator
MTAAARIDFANLPHPPEGKIMSKDAQLMPVMPGRLAQLAGDHPLDRRRTGNGRLVRRPSQAGGSPVKPPPPRRAVAVEGLWFALLGPVRGWLDGAELQLGSPDQRAVLAFLLLREGRPATAGEIIDAVWGEDAPRSVQGVLRTYVYRLRRLFAGMPGGDPLIESVGGGYALPAGGESVDVRVFQQRVAEGRRARQEGDPARAAVLLGEGLGLWQGTPLSGMRGRYADRQRQRLEQLYDGAREEFFAADVERGAHREVIPALAEAVAGSPLCERLRELLMLALYRAGRQAEALAVYTDAYRVLDEELGVAPGAALRELHGAILRADPELELPMGQDGPGLLAAPVPDIPDFTGRDAEIAEITQVLSGWLVEACLLAAIARDALGDLEGAESTLERALDLAESGGALLWFLLHPVPELLERRMRHGTAHADLITGIKIQLAEKYSGIASPRAPARLTAPMSESELRVLRCLPTNPDRAADRGRAVRLARHREDPRAQPVRQARRVSRR